MAQTGGVRVRRHGVGRATVVSIRHRHWSQGDARRCSTRPADSLPPAPSNPWTWNSGPARRPKSRGCDRDRHPRLAARRGGRRCVRGGAVATGRQRPIGVLGPLLRAHRRSRRPRVVNSPASCDRGHGHHGGTALLRTYFYSDPTHRDAFGLYTFSYPGQRRDSAPAGPRTTSASTSSPPRRRAAGVQVDSAELRPPRPQQSSRRGVRQLVAPAHREVEARWCYHGRPTRLADPATARASAPRPR